MDNLDVFDVGHGDSMLFTIDDDKIIPLLIDTGKKKDQIYKRINCEKFNIMITHQDSDHIGGIEELLKYKSDNICKIYISLYLPEIIKIFSIINLIGKKNTNILNNLDSIIDKNLSKIRFVYDGFHIDSKYELGTHNEILNPILNNFDEFQKKSFKKLTYQDAIDILNNMNLFSGDFSSEYRPTYIEGLNEQLIESKIMFYEYLVRIIAFNFKSKKNISIKIKANKVNNILTMASNDVSIILKYENDCSILFTGDAGDNIIREIIKRNKVNKIDILKIPHHGGKNSVENNILKTLKPSYGILSHGNRKFNRGSVPTNTTISELINNNVNILATNNFSTNIYKQKGKVSHNIKGLDIHFK